MLRMLVDTCVWLDMAKTPSQSKNIDILTSLRAEELVDIIVPSRLSSMSSARESVTVSLGSTRRASLRP